MAKSKFALFVIIVLMLFLSVSFGEKTGFSFMDSGEDVAEFKELLVRIGYLNKEDNISNVYDRFTKTAVETIQKDFDLEATGTATPEIRVICELIEKMQSNTSLKADSSKDKPVEIALPNVIGLSAEEGKRLLNNNGFAVLEEYVYDDNKKEGSIFKCERGKGADSLRATIYISKGPKFLYSENSTWYAWWVENGRKDDYELENPYIDRSENKLYIPLDVTINAYSPLKYRGYGTACITDVFDKSVPIQVKYEKEIITRGEKQHVVLVVPLQDLNVEKPTTLSVKIELYQGQNYKKEYHLRMDFTIAW